MYNNTKLEHWSAKPSPVLRLTTMQIGVKLVLYEHAWKPSSNYLNCTKEQKGFENGSGAWSDMNYDLYHSRVAKKPGVSSHVNNQGSTWL